MLPESLRSAYKKQIYIYQYEKLLLEYYVAHLARRCKKDQKDVSFEEAAEDKAYLIDVCDKILAIQKRLDKIEGGFRRGLVRNADRPYIIDNIPYPSVYLKDTLYVGGSACKTWSVAYSPHSSFNFSGEQFYVADYRLLYRKSPAVSIASKLTPLAFSAILLRWTRLEIPTNNYIAFLLSVCTANPSGETIQFPSPSAQLGIAVNKQTKQLGIVDTNDIYAFNGSHITTRNSDWTVVM